MIYFITAREFGRVKIGYSSNDPATRLSALQVGCPTKAALEAVIEGEIEDEKALHAKFSDCRASGEWFVITPEIEELIAANCVVKPKPDLGTVEGLITCLGSASELARRMGVPITTVATWRQKGRIPSYRMDAVREVIGGAA